MEMVVVVVLLEAVGVERVVVVEVVLALFAREPEYISCTLLTIY